MPFKGFGVFIGFSRHFPDTEVIGRDLPSLGGPRQRNSIAAGPLTAKTARCSAPLGRNSLLCVHQGVPLPSLPGDVGRTRPRGAVTASSRRVGSAANVLHDEFEAAFGC